MGCLKSYLSVSDWKRTRPPLRAGIGLMSVGLMSIFVWIFRLLCVIMIGAER